jgi:hypothetical protein
MTGWYKMYRGWRDCEFFATYAPASFCERSAWHWLIENAAWKSTTRTDASGAPVAITRGQIHTSLRALQTAWNWDKSRVERFLNRLQQWEMISHTSTNQGRTLTICNYEAYQSSREAGEEADEKQTRSKRDTQEKEKNKEGKNEGIGGGAAAPTFELPDFIEPELWAEWESFRNRIGHPMTDNARKLIVGKLKKVADSGHSVRDVVEESIMKGWRGIFEPKGLPKEKNLLAGLSYSAAKEKLVGLEYNVEMYRQMIDQDADRWRPKFREAYTAREEFVKAMDAKWPPHKKGSF